MTAAAALTEDLLTLVVGFGLTTVVGGMLGAHFQRRTFDHQNERTLAEADRTQATNTCRDLSLLMDKRLYRMLLFRGALFADRPDRDAIEARLGDYRAVLLDWNDNLMRNLAAAEIVFGSALRERLEAEIYEGFVSAGHLLESRYEEVVSSAAETSPDVATVDAALAQLRERIYALNLQMLSQIRDGHVGRRAPGAPPPDAAA